MNTKSKNIEMFIAKTLILAILFLSSRCIGNNLNPEMIDLSQMFYDYPSDPTFNVQFLDRSKLDYSIDSLDHVNAFLESVRLQRNSIPEKKFNPLVLRIGAYVGEVIRKNSKTKKIIWVSFEKAASQSQLIKSLGENISTIAILQVEGEDDFSFPLGKVLKYLEFGEAENLKFFAQSIILDRKK
ncbi:MAG: hypothetical protein IPO37_02705 [Saprospiraceae bacterium]|nr:hypothetical protein [Saprospiraceae bacterium]MBP6740086.1 hypothetical protein [Leptospiraceae bacterium]